ncbi:MAG TPA: MarP family serine protease [Candidatus Saccharimonadales bacterium]|nr:MarP family serine protease [Candidatus Saccharimonadales bacterium]
MNLIDVLIIVLIILSILRGAEVGAIQQIFSTIGFFLGIFIGAWVSHWFVHFAHTSLSRSWVALIVTISFGLVLLAVGEYVGVILKKRVDKNKDRQIADRSAGAVIGMLTLLVTVWLTAAILVRLPFPNLQNDLRNSSIISFLDRKLPPAPTAIAELSHAIDPDGFPQVFNGAEPVPLNINTPTPSLGVLTAAVNKDRASVVKVEGRGCGGIVEGSGFVVAKDLVVTNAHVVAGVAQPYVLDSNGDHAATAIWFDPNLDFAVLQVDNLAGAPLTIDTTIAANGTSAVVMGYPGGGGFMADPAAILDEFVADGANIYGQGNTNRNIYEIKATVIPGNSGGPLATANGQVIGIVFAQSTTYNQVGYALTMQKAVSELHQAEQTDVPVSTGQCAQ